jgi:hypothetical protein
MQILALILLAAASLAHAAGPAPRLWEAVRPGESGVHIYVLVSTDEGQPLEYDSYFDKVVLPAFAQAEVLHYEGGEGLPPDSHPPCAPGVRARKQVLRTPGAAFMPGERPPPMRVADFEPAAVPGLNYCSMGKGRIILAPLARDQSTPEAPGGPAAVCRRNARWLRTLSGLRDGRTHFVVADAEQVRDAQAPAGRCRGILNGLWDAGFVVWPVAEFRPGAKP